MNLQPLPNLEDQRLAPYRNLRERTLRGEALFIAEGDLVVERLLDSRYDVESLLVCERAWERVSPLLTGKVPEGVPIFRVPYEGMGDVLGFAFHQGVLALGKRAEFWTLDDLVPDGGNRHPRSAGRRVIVALPDITKPDNMGVVFRNCAALGADGVLLGPQACDPLTRRGLRVSMGGVFQLPWLKTDDLGRDLRALRARGYTVYATTLSDAAIPMSRIRWSDRLVLCFGNEYAGLAPELVAQCDAEVTIPMACGVDSLNLGVSSGIFLYDACGSEARAAECGGVWR